MGQFFFLFKSKPCTFKIWPDSDLVTKIDQVWSTSVFHTWSRNAKQCTAKVDQVQAPLMLYKSIFLLVFLESKVPKLRLAEENFNSLVWDCFVFKKSGFGQTVIQCLQKNPIRLLSWINLWNIMEKIVRKLSKAAGEWLTTKVGSQQLIS